VGEFCFLPITAYYNPDSFANVLSLDHALIIRDCIMSITNQDIQWITCLSKGKPPSSIIVVRVFFHNNDRSFGDLNNTTTTLSHTLQSCNIYLLSMAQQNEGAHYKKDLAWARAVCSLQQCFVVIKQLCRTKYLCKCLNQESQAAPLMDL